MRGFHAWSDYLHQQALGGGKEPIYINLDETALSMSASDSKGLIVHKKWWGNRLRPGQRISLSRKRRMVTHVCMVTGNSQLQPELPQVFIGNHRCFSEKDLHDVAGAVPGSVQFWRKKSSWNTSALMCEILNELAKVASKHPTKQFILVLDCASIHLTVKVCQKAAELKIWLLFVPARCTWLAQPLDCFVFHPYKSLLKNLYRDAKDENGQVSDLSVLKMYGAVCTQLLNKRKWGKAFEATGIVGNRTELTRDLRALNVYEAAPAKPNRIPAPSYKELAGLFPKGKSVAYWWLISAGPLGRKRRLVVR